MSLSLKAPQNQNPTWISIPIVLKRCQEKKIPKKFDNVFQYCQSLFVINLLQHKIIHLKQSTCTWCYWLKNKFILPM